MTCRVRAVCRGDAVAVLERAKEVLERVLEIDPQNWPSTEEWRARLPAWFVASCAPEITIEEAEQEQIRWRSLSQEEQIRKTETGRWTLSGWIYFFLPDDRCWLWWNARIPNEDTLFVHMIVDGWPFAWGELDWLLRASGAVRTELAVSDDFP
jgi:hypothetical protein